MPLRRVMVFSEIRRRLLVEVGDGFVDDEALRSLDSLSGNRDALPLPAGALRMALAVGPMFSLPAADELVARSAHAPDDCSYVALGVERNEICRMAPHSAPLNERMVSAS